MNDIIRYFNEECIRKFLDLREKLYEDPENLAGFIRDIRKETDEIARRTIQQVIQEMNDLIKRMPDRKEKWVVERKGDAKRLTTSVGDIIFQKTLYKSKTEVNDQGKPLQCYLVDKVLGLSPNQTMTEDAVANILTEAVQTSYRKGGEAASPDGVTRGTVKNLLHGLKFPEGPMTPRRKKEVSYLYIEADEDHYHLQFNDHRGDLERDSAGRKINGAITKLIYVHEGLEPEAPKSKRYRLVSPHYFCRGEETDNKTLWEEVCSYIRENYDVKKIKRIYLNSDGGPWIQTVRGKMAGITFVLDGYHLSKYVSKLTRHMEDSSEDARSEIYDSIRSKTKEDFFNVVERLKECADTDKIRGRIDEAARYIVANWTAAKYRLKRSEGVIGSSTEGHVYQVLSSRMSTLPMGWSRLGGSQMARLREYYYNGGSMVELARYQKEELPLAAGAEETVLSATKTLRSEKTKRTKELQEYGKYSETMRGSLSAQGAKKLIFQLRGKI